MDDKRRMDDVIAARTEQKLDDFMAETRDRWKRVDTRLELLEEFVHKVNGPFKVATWAIIIVMASFLGVIGKSIAAFIQRHWN